MMTIYNVTEATLLPFLWASVRGRRPYVLSVEAYFPPANRILERCTKILVAAGLAREPWELCPGLEHLRLYPVSAYMHDIFGECEPAFERHFEFDLAERTVADYAMAYKLATAGCFISMQIPILLLDGMLRALADQPVRIRGLSSDVASMFSAYFGERREIAPRRASGVCRLFNFPIFAIVTAYSTLWALSRIRYFSSPPEQIFLLADGIGARRDLAMFSELANGGPIVIVPRAEEQHGAEERDALHRFRTIPLSGGRFTLRDGIGAAAQALRDGLRLYRRLGGRRAPHYYRVAWLPFRRLVERALLGRFRPRFHWGRDMYNPEHVLRRQEVNRVGAQTLGILSGWGAYALRVPHCSYVSYDRFYLFGRTMYERYLRPTWDPEMEVVAAGSSGVTRDDVHRLRRRPEGQRDIVVFTSLLAVFDHVGGRQFVRDLAAAFPDRTVRLQVKAPFRGRNTANAFVDACTRGLPNLVYAENNLVELIECSGYAFSDPSTVVIECLQFGVPSFMIDVLEFHRTCFYRDFPDLCISSASQAIERIRAMESGDWHYPRETYDGLIDLSGRVALDVIREDLGLPPLETPCPQPALQHGGIDASG